MEIKKVTSVYFSPTGGTKKVSAFLAESLGFSTEDLDITDYEAGREPESFSPDELVIFSVPVYVGRVPAAAAEKIRRFHGNSNPAIVMAVYGNRDYEDALLELKDLVSGNGFIPAAAISAVAEHSIMRHYAAGRPDETDEEKIKNFGETILTSIHNIETTIEIPDFPVKGNPDYRKSNGVLLKPAAGEACTGCGICSIKCPVHTIPGEAPSETDEETCISCMRCISVCPVGARNLDHSKVSRLSQALAEEFKERKESELFLFQPK